MILELDLQFFAKEGPGGEKTEEPTAKKKSDTRKDGKVAKSKELSAGVELIALFLILKFWVGSMGERFMGLFDKVYNKIPQLTSKYEGYTLVEQYGIVFRGVMLHMLILVLPFFVIGIVIAFGVNMMQFKFQVSMKPLQPKFSKLSPIAGMKRLFSAEKVVELVKSIFKIILITFVVYDEIKDKGGYLWNLYDIPLTQGIALIGDIVIGVGLKVSLFFLAIAFADFAYQKYKFNQDIKMTKQEVKDEYKNAEGDPQIKGKIRQKMREVSQRRMMQDLTKADVVITNPTHFAVAIKYSPEENAAPIVVAKGADYLAQKIKAVARENKIEIVENKPLARMLYANVEIGQEVPPELYQAVAEVLAMVYKMQGKM